MVNLSVGILHHPARAALLPGLLAALNSDEPIVVTTDTGGGYWETAKTAWRAHDAQATHVLLLQDDVIPCLDMLLAVRFALEEKQNDPISLFTASAKLRAAAGMGFAWAVGQSLSWSQGIVLPVAWIESWLHWADIHCRRDIKSHDARLSAFLLAAGLRVYYTVPCLVEHGAPNDSLIGNNRSDVIPRKAGLWLGAQWSAVTVDWSAGADKPFRLTTPGKKAFASVLNPDSPFVEEFV